MIDTLKVFDVDGSAAIACRIFLFYGVCLLKESAPGRYAEVTGVIAISLCYLLCCIYAGFRRL